MGKEIQELEDGYTRVCEAQALVDAVIRIVHSNPLGDDKGPWLIATDMIIAMLKKASSKLGDSIDKGDAVLRVRFCEEITIDTAILAALGAIEMASRLISPTSECAPVTSNEVGSFLRTLSIELDALCMLYTIEMNKKDVGPWQGAIA